MQTTTVKMQVNIAYSLLFAFSCTIFYGCDTNKDTDRAPDLILYNAVINPIRGSVIENGAVAITNGRITGIGASDEILSKWNVHDSARIDCRGAFLMPGFIEGHGHFSSLGYSLIHIDLMETNSWHDIVDSVAQRVKKAKPGEWILGRGWHQEKWNSSLEKNVHGYPYHDALSAVSPLNPVILSHASGHSLFANESAMQLAGISKETGDPPGGHIVKDASGTPLGVFEERAMDIIRDIYQEHLNTLSPEQKLAEWKVAVRKAEEHCLRHGITSFQDAGAGYREVYQYKNLAESDSLDIRLWIMLRNPYDTLKNRMSGFPFERIGRSMMTCLAIKSEIDGALGSYGAWLLEPYDDKPGFTGQNTTPVHDVRSIAGLAIDHGMQLCVHAIGDRGNREVLNIFEETFQQHPDKKDLRWRMEHAQHLHTDDMGRFQKLGVIASMQGIHCISDAPFVVKRLGEKRAKEGAYAWRSLIGMGVLIANGTDAPVERVDPLQSIYASVTRKRLDTDEAFFPEQSMTREEAIASYTWNNAYAAFEEDIKGSIEVGKLADLVVLSQNLLSCPQDSIMKTRILMTLIGGKIKYDASDRDH